MASEKTTKSSILIAHLADTHLRDSQYTTAKRGLDFFEAAKSAVLKACDAADVIVLVGDVFDSARPSPRVIGQLMQLDNILSEKGKVMLTTTGNHDWCSPTWLSTLFPGRLSSDRTVDSSARGVIPIDGELVDYCGFKFVGVHPYSASSFRHNCAETADAVRDADVVLYHGLVDGIVDLYAGQDALHVREFPISENNKAWLLGDVHIQGYVNVDRPDGGQTLVGYPGSLEMCSASEPTDKSLPLIRVTRSEATVQESLPLCIRPFISREIDSLMDLDALMEDVAKIADSHPVVIAKFNRGLPQTINRLHSVLDAQRAVIRCYPLPVKKSARIRAVDKELSPSLSMEHFVTNRFKDRQDLEEIAVALLHRGDADAVGILSSMIETRLENTSVGKTKGN
jgi:DNA repair exonuclease SbcCD nuclease subunit